MNEDLYALLEPGQDPHGFLWIEIVQGKPAMRISARQDPHGFLWIEIRGDTLSTYALEVRIRMDSCGLKFVTMQAYIVAAKSGSAWIPVD